MDRLTSARPTRACSAPPNTWSRLIGAGVGWMQQFRVVTTSHPGPTTQRLLHYLLMVSLLEPKTIARVCFVFKSEDLATLLWQRLCPFVPDCVEDAASLPVHESPLGLEGEWTSHSLNPVFRLVRYERAATSRRTTMAT